MSRRDYLKHLGFATAVVIATKTESPMTLPKNIENKILTESYRKYNLTDQGGQREGYQAGATEWAGRAQDCFNLLSEMRDCLDAVLIINEVRPLQDSELIEDINNALAKYKEVSNI